jgi:hypothetical protein
LRLSSGLFLPTDLLRFHFEPFVSGRCIRSIGLYRPGIGQNS